MIQIKDSDHANNSKVAACLCFGCCMGYFSLLLTLPLSLILGFSNAAGGHDWSFL
jgi:hypothetical protein